MTARNREDGTSGACFIIELPLGKEHLKNNQIYSEYVDTGMKQRRSAANRNCKILLVDDDIEICRYIKSELSDWYRFVICNNGKAALKQLLSGDFDLVVSDVVMPEMDGIEALKKIKALDPGAKIIMCSAMGQQAMVIESIQSGAKDFIVKPFQADRVIEAVQKVVG